MSRSSLAIGAAVVLMLFTVPSFAVTTESFVVETSAKFLEGTLDGVAVSSNGHVSPSLALRRTPLDTALTAYCAARGRDGTLYVGTGTDGVIYRMVGDAIEPFARTNQLLVASLAFDEAGTLYAGTLPEGRVYAIATNGTARELVQLEHAEHVWSLAWDRRRGKLIAATGPDARVYAIDTRASRAELLYDGTDVHVMSLALADDGTIYAGTTERALVVRIAQGRTDVVLDAPGNEITALAFRDGSLVIAANEFQPVAASGAPTNPRSAPPVGRSRPRPGKARLFRIDRDGRTEKIFEENDGHVTDLELAANDVVYAAGGKDGRIYRIDADRVSSVYVDVDERQVLALGLTAEPPYFVTGDGAAVYRVDPRPTAAPSWTSAVLDATNASTFGQVVLRGAGAIEWASRTGNVDSPDDTWSAWSAFQRSGTPVASPAARYLQIKVRFPASGASELRSLTAFYLGPNQRPVVSGVTQVVDAAQALQRRRGRLAPTSTVRLTWRIDNPDSDDLRYRLKIRRDGEPAMRELLRSDVVHTATTYDWDTQGIPDGLYIVIVEASDELSNASGNVLRSISSSDPIVVDNHAPRIEGLSVRGDAVVGRAIDAIGPISRLEIAIDGLPYRDIDSEDGLLDSSEEGFRVPVASIGAGPHTLAVRATDATGHPSVEEITLGR